MKGIKNSQYQNKVKQIFELEVLEGKHKGIYNIKEPGGFREVNIIVDVNETYFNIDNFILGETSKIKFIQHADTKTFDLIRDVYNEQGGDGQILFRWKISNNGQETDILGEGFEINLNKYKLTYDKSGQCIECEIKKREAQNKFFTREDTTINLFATKNIDGRDIKPVQTKDILFKYGNSTMKGAWYISTTNENENLFAGLPVSNITVGTTNPPDYHGGRPEPLLPKPTAIPPFFPVFNRSESSQIGEVYENFSTSPFIIIYSTRAPNDIDHSNPNSPTLRLMGSKPSGRMLYTKLKITDYKIEISNLNAKSSLKKCPIYKPGQNHPLGYEQRPLEFALYAVIIKDNEWVYEKELEKSIRHNNYSSMDIKNKTYTIEKEIPANGELRLVFRISEKDTPVNNETILSYGGEFLLENTRTSIEVHVEIDNLAIKTKTVRLFDAIDKIAENYSGGKLFLKSNTLRNEYIWGNQMVTTGLSLRDVALGIIGEEKINTSFKSLFFDGVHPLLALGYDVQDKFIVVEDIGYFFKDFLSYDLTDKPFIEESFSINNDTNNAFNTLVFGTKKFSTKKNNDLKNFNTKMECSTPIKSIKKKFDKTTNLIIDEYKIQELLLDKSSSTNDNDDDVIIIDTIHKYVYADEGTFGSIKHVNVNGRLVLISNDFVWGSFPIEIGSQFSILEGLNTGLWKVLDINKTKLTLNKYSNIQEGVSPNRVRYTLSDIIKNRNATSSDGFEMAHNVRNQKACANLVHNPKYQLNRWFPYFSGGLSKKENHENISVSSYKNNGAVVVQPSTHTFYNVISGVEQLDDSISLGKLRNQNKSFFNGERIEITLTNVSFEEFYDLYNKWRYGIDITSGKEIESRGYIDVKADKEIISIYPIGSNALEYERAFRELTIKGKIKKKREV